MRILASETLHRLVSIEPPHFIEAVLPALVCGCFSSSLDCRSTCVVLSAPLQIPDTTSLDQNISHGALLSVAEICLALTHCCVNNYKLADIWQNSSNDLRHVCTFAMITNFVSYFLNPLS